MPVPRDLRILRHLRDAMRAIRVDDGYHSDVIGTAVKLDPDQGVEELIRSEEEGAAPPPRPFVLLEVLPDGYEYFPASQVRQAINIRVNWISDSDPKDDEAKITAYFNGCADIEQASQVDTTRGGDAVDTRIVRRTYDTANEGAEVWVMVDLQILTHRTFGAPNS